MDLIRKIKDAETARLNERLNEYEDKLLIASHSGDLASVEVSGLTLVRADTFKEMLSHELGYVVIISGELMGSISKVVTDLGVNIRVLVNIPGASPEALFEQNRVGLPTIDYISLVGDVAERRFMEDNMTAEELANSKANQQIDRLSNKKGDIKRLSPFSFDGNVEGGPDDSRV